MLQHPFLHFPQPIRKCITMLQMAAARHISAYAACACFFLVLALFPAMILSCSVLQYVGLHETDLLNAVSPFFPAALLPLAEQLLQVLFSINSVSKLSLTALLTIWSASRGVYSIMLGLNAVCALTDHRSYLRRRLICAAYLLLAIFALPISLSVQLFTSAHLQHITPLFTLGLIFSALYRAFPDTRLRMPSCLAAGFFAAAGWQLFSFGYSWYAQRATRYSAFYGSFAYSALGLLWLYFCMMILLFGGFLANEFHRQQH